MFFLLVYFVQRLTVEQLNTITNCLKLLPNNFFLFQISCASAAGFYRILEVLYENGGEFDKILRCYIDDPMRNLQSFVFIQKVFLESEYPQAGVDPVTDKKGSVEKSVLKDLFALLSIDARKTATVIYYHMYPFIPLVLSKLESNKKELFNFLKFVLDLREGGSQPNSPIKSSSRWKDEDVLSLNETYETYVELMAEFEPRRVAAYLKSKVSRYRNQKVLKICQKFQLVEAQAFILEEEGQVDEAFDLMKKDLDEKMTQISTSTSETSELSWTQLNASVLLVIQFCQRVSSKSTDARKHEKLWFGLLDALVRLVLSLFLHSE